MKKEEIYFPDWQRLLIGNVPWEFMLEVLIRTLIIFVALLIVLRLMGKRMNGQLTISEFAVMVTLGGIASAPMQLPERGVLLGIICFICALLFQRGLNLLAFRNRKIEVITQGDLSIIMSEGVLQIKEMEKARLSKDQVFAALRTHNITHLGQVRRLYMEACGLFSIVKAQKASPGLPIIPLRDQDLIKSLSMDDRHSACTRCGHVTDSNQVKEKHCPECACDEWTTAVC